MGLYMWTILSIISLAGAFITYWVVFFILCYRFRESDREKFSEIRRGRRLLKYFKSEKALFEFGGAVRVFRFVEITYYILFAISVALFLFSVTFVREFI